MSAKHAIKTNKKWLFVLRLFKTLKLYSYNPFKLNVICLKPKHLIEKLSLSFSVRIVENCSVLLTIYKIKLS